MNKVKVSTEQFCPFCYNKFGVMRNVYLSEDRQSLVCPIHGSVMTEDVDLKKYQEQDYNQYLDNIGLAPESEVAIVGQAVINQSTLG